MIRMLTYRGRGSGAKMSCFRQCVHFGAALWPSKSSKTTLEESKNMNVVLKNTRSPLKT